MREKNNILADADHFLRIKINLTNFKNKNKYLKKNIGQRNKSNKIAKTADYLDNLSIFLKIDWTDFKNENKKQGRKTMFYLKEIFQKILKPYKYFVIKF